MSANVNLCQCFSKTLPLPYGEGNKVIVPLDIPCLVQKSLRSKSVTITPVVTLESDMNIRENEKVKAFYPYIISFH